MRKHLKNICLLVVIGLSSCSQRAHEFRQTGGTYRYVITRDRHTKTVVVTGMISDLSMNRPLKLNGAVKVNDQLIIKTDATGHFLFNLPPGRYTFTGTGFPYQQCRTRPIRLAHGDTLNLQFYLRDKATTIN